jgi:hypothetical protein
MLARFRPLAGGLLVGTFVTMSLLSHSPSCATAETSFRKLEKRLHTAEHKTGVVLSQVGQALADGLSNATVEFSFESSDDTDSQAPGTAPHAGKSASKTAHLPYFAKPSVSAPAAR